MYKNAEKAKDIAQTGLPDNILLEWYILDKWGDFNGFALFRLLFWKPYSGYESFYNGQTPVASEQIKS